MNRDYDGDRPMGTQGTMIFVDIVTLDEAKDIPLPSYMTPAAAGMDVRAAVTEDTVIVPGERRLIPTGFTIALPVGYEAQLRPRSGMALHHGITLLNAPGTIDADYRGEVCVIVVNHGKKPFTVKRGDRIAQMIVQPVVRVVWNRCHDLEGTERGDGGFGHTG